MLNNTGDTSEFSISRGFEDARFLECFLGFLRGGFREFDEKCIDFFASSLLLACFGPISTKVGNILQHIWLCDACWAAGESEFFKAGRNGQFQI